MPLEDWFYRPWLAGKCSFESLIDGTLDIADIAFMNHAMDVDQENRWRMAEAFRDKR